MTFGSQVGLGLRDRTILQTFCSSCVRCAEFFSLDVYGISPGCCHVDDGIWLRFKITSAIPRPRQTKYHAKLHAREYQAIARSPSQNPSGQTECQTQWQQRCFAEHHRERRIAPRRHRLISSQASEIRSIHNRISLLSTAVIVYNESAPQAHHFARGTRIPKWSHWQKIRTASINNNSVRVTLGKHQGQNDSKFKSVYKCINGPDTTTQYPVNLRAGILASISTECPCTQRIFISIPLIQLALRRIKLVSLLACQYAGGFALFPCSTMESKVLTCCPVGWRMLNVLVATFWNAVQKRQVKF